MANGSEARTIVPLVAFATGIALVGHTLEPAKSKASPHVGDAQILLGGTAAAVILTLVSTAGTPGDKFAKGIAVILLLSSIALYATPVTTALSKVTGQATGNPNTTKPPAKQGATK